MLKKRWLNVVHMLSACRPCLSRDVQRCRRWPGWRLFHIALHGGVLIESGHSPSSGGYTCDAVLLDRTVAEHDTCYSCNRSMGGSWTSYNLSPWVVGLQLTCCYNLCCFFQSSLVFLSCDVPVTSLTLSLTILLTLWLYSSQMVSCNS